MPHSMMPTCLGGRGGRPWTRGRPLPNPNNLYCRISQ